jgi:hypothetical protein
MSQNSKWATWQQLSNVKVPPLEIKKLEDETTFTELVVEPDPVNDVLPVEDPQTTTEETNTTTVQPKKGKK